MNKSRIRLVSIYRTENATKSLYKLLKSRDEKTNISHRQMPTWAKHVKFIRSKPYKSWEFIRALSSDEILGSVYLTATNEIGIFLFPQYRGMGYGRDAVALLIKKNAKEERFLANINPKNGSSIDFFKELGFIHIQNTYELRTDNKKGK